MSIVIPSEMEQTLTAQAAHRHITPEQLVKEALTWYLQLDREFLDELAAWQEIRDEALELVENPAPS